MLASLAAIMPPPCSPARRLFASPSYYYVDDLVITGDDSAMISLIKLQLNNLFEMKDLGPLKDFLDIEVAYSPRGFQLGQLK